MLGRDFSPDDIDQMIKDSGASGEPPMLNPNPNPNPSPNPNPNSNSNSNSNSNTHPNPHPNQVSRPC